MVIQFHPLTECLTQDWATVFLYPKKQKRDSREGVREVSKSEKEGEQRYLAYTNVKTRSGLLKVRRLSEQREVQAGVIISHQS